MAEFSYLAFVLQPALLQEFPLTAGVSRSDATATALLLLAQKHALGWLFWKLDGVFSLVDLRPDSIQIRHQT